MLAEISVSIDNCKHIAKTQATLGRASPNLKTPREHFSHVQIKLKEINLCQKLACAEAQLKKCQDKEAQRWPNNPEVAHNC